MNARFKLYADLLLVRIRTNFFLVIISAFTVDLTAKCLESALFLHYYLHGNCMFKLVSPCVNTQESWNGN